MAQLDQVGLAWVAGAQVVPRARRAAAAQPLRRLHGREASGDVQLAPGSDLGRDLGRRAARRAAVLRGMRQRRAAAQR